MYSSEEIEPVEGSGSTKKDNMSWRLKKIDREVWELCNYDLSLLREFPNNVKQHESPALVCKRKDFADFENIALRIA